MPFVLLLKLNFISLFYGTFLPGQVSGDLVKAYKLTKLRGDGKKVAASILIDRFTGLAGIFVLGSLGLIFSKAEFIPKEIRIIIFIGFALFFGCFILLSNKLVYSWSASLFASYKQNKSKNKLQNCFQYVLEFSQSLLSQMRQRKSILYAVALGIIFQILAILINQILGHDLGILISFWDWSWIFAVISVVLIIPISIAGLGVREIGFIGILNLFCVPADQAVALSFLVMAIILVGAFIGAILEAIDHFSPYNK